MIQITRSERQWLLRNIAQGLADYLGTVDPPVQIEDLLKHPPPVYESDIGIVDMQSTLWDAAFARPPDKCGSIFVQSDLDPLERRYALARETLSAVLTSKHGKASGLFNLFIPHLRESAEYFARYLLLPMRLLRRGWDNGRSLQEYAAAFQVPHRIARERIEETLPDT